MAESTITLPDPYNLIITGVGGQGNVLASRMVGDMLSRLGLHVTIGETFGAAQRGGSVYSSLRVSKRKVYGPLVPEGKAHVIMGLEPLESFRMLTIFGNPEVVTLTNTNPIYPVGVLSKRVSYPSLHELRSTIQTLSKASKFLDATAIATDLESPIVTNIVMLGAITAMQSIPMTLQEVEDEIRRSFPTSKLELNLRAFRLGLNAISVNDA